MRRLLAVLALAALFLLGVGGALAVGETTGTVSVCATASTPVQTISANGVRVGTIPSKTATSCATATYTIPTSTVTGPTTTVTVAPPPTSTSSTTSTTTTTSTETTTTVSPSSTCGATPTGDLPGWTQVFSDGFDQPVPLGSFPEAVGSRWFSYPYPWKDTSGRGTYDPHRTTSIHDGTMDIWLHTVNGEHLVSAPVPIVQPGSHDYGSGQLYGRFSVCFKSDPVEGYKTAWLLWPNNENWPADGEIDFPEGHLTGTISAYMHREGGTSGSDQDVYDTATTYTDWHTATVEWTPSRCTFILDGQTIGESTSRIPNTTMHWVLQTETRGSVVPLDAASGHLLVDWVSAYIPA